MVNVDGVLVSVPPLAVPPLSCTRTVMVALPLALAAGVKVSWPLGLIAGCVENRAVFELPVSWKLRVCVDSQLGPAETAVAQGCAYAPESSSTVTAAPAVKLGA